MMIMHIFIFGLIVYNLAKVYMQKNFLMALVQVIIVDQLNQTVQLYEIQATVIYSCAILETERSECCVKRVTVSVKPGLGPLQTVQTLIRGHWSRR